MAKTLIGIAIAVALLAGMTFMAMNQNPASCEVCMEFEGRRACASASARDREEAQEAAANSACSVITGGVTSTIKCSHMEPVSVNCGE
jgi:hypothetical protein